MPMSAAQIRIFLDVAAERERQDAKFGDQIRNGDVVPGCAIEVMHEYELPSADVARRACDLAFKTGRGTWGHILTEEVCEAIEAAAGGGADGRAAMRNELVQVAAVVVAWIEALDRRTEMSDQ